MVETRHLGSVVAPPPRANIHVGPSSGLASPIALFFPQHSAAASEAILMVGVVGWHTITVTKRLFSYLVVLPRRLSGEPVQRHSTTASKAAHDSNSPGLPEAKPAATAIWIVGI